MLGSASQNRKNAREFTRLSRSAWHTPCSSNGRCDVLEPAFDPVDTLARLDDDVELFAELVESFSSDASKGLWDIRRSIDEGDGAALACAAHTLRGLVSIFAAAPAIRATAALERAAKEGTFCGIDAQVTELESTLQRLEYDLSAFVTQIA